VAGLGEGQRGLPKFVRERNNSKRKEEKKGVKKKSDDGSRTGGKSSGEAETRKTPSFKTNPLINPRQGLLWERRKKRPHVLKRRRALPGALKEGGTDRAGV